MLSAFTALPIVELKQRDKSKIESLLTYGDKLLVGLNTGSLRVYRINESAEPKAVELLREQEKFSKYKIDQLALIKEANILISLSNGFVSIHDLLTYELHETLTKSRGATTFAVTSNIVKDQGIPSIVSRLAVAVKRKLLLWSWQDSEPTTQAQELTLVTGIKTLTWATGTRLIAGLSASYVLVDVETSGVTDIVGPGSIGGAPGQDGGRFGGVGVASIGYMGMGGMIPRPLATGLGEGELLLAKDINTHFIDTDGNALGRRQIPWAVAPEAIAYSYPFLLSLQATKGLLEVRNPETLTALQSISLPSASQIHVPNPSVSLAHAGKGFLVSSERAIWRMDALGYDAQIDTLFEKRRYDEAISLLGMLEDALLQNKPGRLQEAKMLKAQELFDMRRYRDSLDLFTEVSAPPERVISLYPKAISGDLRDRSDQQNPPRASDASESLSKATDGTAASSQAKDESQPNRPSSKKESKQTPTSSPSKAKPASTPIDQGDAASQTNMPSTNLFQRRELEGKDLKMATSELAGFLVESRTKLQRYINPDGSLKDSPTPPRDGTDGESDLDGMLAAQRPGDSRTREQRLQDTAELVDTTLFRAYMLTSPSMAGPLFRLPNFCNADVVNEKLLETKRYHDLIDFLYGKRLHRQALDLLKKFGQGRDDADCPPQLRGPQRTIAYLQNLPPQMVDLVLEYAEWPLRADPDQGMDVFIADTENAETMPRDKVHEFLKGIDPKFGLQYLEHIIQELDDGTPAFHQSLINEYLSGLKQDQDETKKSQLKERLLNFLRTSKHYEFWRVLRTLPTDDPDLYAARAIILGKMGEHRKALNIYVFDMEDSGKAEEYCNQVFMTETTSATASTQSRRSSTSTDDGPPSPYNILLSLYLSPPPPRKPQWGPALDLLAKHGSRLPASSTLGLIPEILPVQKLESYFTLRIRSANTIVNEGRVVAGLQKTLDVSEEASLRLGEGKPGGHFGRNRRVVITEERVCGVCHKRFGGSAIKVMPDNAVVHYGCSVR